MELDKTAIKQRLELLKELDETIDFAKSVIQLGVVLTLYGVGEGLTIDELSHRLGERRKALLDALRKLELKGVIDKVEVNGNLKVLLTEKGNAYVKKLESLLAPQSAIKVDSDLDYKTKRALILNNIVEAHYIYTAITALGKSPTKALSLDKLAREMGLSNERAKSYLDLFCLPPNRIFRRVQIPGKGTYYKLEEEGLKIFYRTPEYRGKSARKIPLSGDEPVLVISSVAFSAINYWLLKDLLASLAVLGPCLSFLLFRLFSMKMK